MVIQGFKIFFLISFLTHLGVIFHDQILKKELVNKLPPPPELVRELNEITNIEKGVLSSSAYSQKTKEELKKFLENKQEMLQEKIKKAKSAIDIPFNQIIPKSEFTNKEKSSEDTLLKIYLSKAQVPANFEQKKVHCEDKDSFIGIGLNLSTAVMTGSDLYTIKQIAPNYVGDRANFKPEQVLLGIIPSTGEFYPGNSYVAKRKAKEGEEVKVIIRDGSTIFEKKINLEKICYNALAKNNPAK